MFLYRHQFCGGPDQEDLAWPPCSSPLPFGPSSNRCFRPHHRPPRRAVGLASRTARPSPVSCRSCRPGVPGASCRPIWAAGRASPAGAACATGRPSASSPGSTTCCLTTSVRRDGSTGNGRVWTARSCPPKRGRSRGGGRPQSHRPRASRHQAPSDHRSDHRPAGDAPRGLPDRGQPAGQHGLRAPARSGARHPNAEWSPASATAQAPRRQGVRPPHVPAGAAPAPHRQPDRPAGH